MEKIFKDIIQKALKEDIGEGDITTESFVKKDIIFHGTIISKSNGILCGTEFASECFKTLNPDAKIKAIKNDLRGLWHLIPDGFVSRYDWAKKINEILNLNVDLIKASQSDFNSPAKRPEFSAMSNSKIKKDLSVDIKSWEEYLYDYLTLLDA